MKNAPILDIFDDEGNINKNTYTKNKETELGQVALLKEYNINTAIFVFVKDIKEIERQDLLEEFYNFKNGSSINKCYIYNKKFVLAPSSLGCPAAAAMMEELGFFGITNFFACGSAGQIDEKIDSKKFILVDKAIRDEGLSYHYLSPSTYAQTNQQLTNSLAKYLDDNGYEYVKATTWTTDAFFRETPKALELRKSQGAVCVEMECSGWCAVSQFRGYKFAQLLYFSDAVNQNWSWHESRVDLKKNILRLMLDFLEKFVDEK